MTPKVAGHRRPAWFWRQPNGPDRADGTGGLGDAEPAGIPRSEDRRHR
jgi:hypothetical protein